MAVWQPYMHSTTYERANSKYLQHLDNLFYTQNSARLLTGYNPIFSTPSMEKALGAKQNLSPSRAQSDHALT